MELGNKIRSLRLKAGLTQEMLAEALGVSFQSVSKWENNVCAPDIAMLPKLSVYFGVTIDELFDLSVEQKLRRIESMLEVEAELTYSIFTETIAFLKEQLETTNNKGKIYSLLARTYHHRVLSDCVQADKYARKSLQEAPEVKDCQWIFQKTQGAAICDWNVRNHHRIISFYQELIAEHPEGCRNYLELMDNLLADNRTGEAAAYLELYKQQAGHMELQVPIYEGRIALAEHRPELTEQKFRELEERFPDNWHAMFELANYYADQCQYDQAIAHYEKSFALEPKPRYVDALWGVATIYEIQGKYKEAISCCDRILQTLREEHGYTEGAPLQVPQEEKQRLMKKLEPF